MLLFNLILYLFQEDYIQPEATSSSPQCYYYVFIQIQTKNYARILCLAIQYRTSPSEEIFGHRISDN